MNEWAKAAEKGNIVEAICLYVTENDWTIYPDLITDFKKYIRTEGELALYATSHVVLWEGMSYKLILALAEGINEGRLHILPISKTVYTLSGFKVPSLPIVEYRKNMADVPAHSWASTCLRIAPVKKPKKKKG